MFITMSSNTKSRDYCYTLNNYTQEEYETILGLDAQYQVIGKEVGAEGTKHLQGYIYFSNPRSFNAVKKLLPRAHLERTSGTPEQASAYCKKDNDFYEIGTCPRQGKRTDVEVVREELHLGNGIRGVVRRATNLQQIKIAEAILKYEEPKRDWKPEVIWYWGLTGTGKSRTAHEDFEGLDFYRKTANTGKWWEGYDAHEFVLIDDMALGNYEYKNLLDLLDRYECRVECKNGTRQFLAKKIIITASFPPDVMFQHEDQSGKEIIRRIDLVKRFV